MEAAARSTACALLLFAGCALVAAPQTDSLPPALSMPSWLAAYPGATPAIRESGSLLEATYTTPASPAEVVEHYRKLFEAAGLKFHPNPDGIGTAVRGAAAECDLLLLIHPQRAATFVDVNCAAKSPGSAAVPSGAVEIISGAPSRTAPQTASRSGIAPRAARPVNSPPPVGAPLTAAEMEARHAQLAKQLGIHPEYHDAPAPPLVWPSWLTDINGAKLLFHQGVDQSKKGYLEGRYTSTEPMSSIYRFYQGLLASHEYPIHSSELSTGQTISGVQQNALGHVEGTNYPDGAPGPRTVIRVDFSRSRLNEPITVRMKITAYEFVAPKSRF